MKPILICYPPFEGKNYLKKRAPFPIGPLYLAAYLWQYDIKAKVKDFSYPPKHNKTERPSQLQTGQSSYYRWGYSDKRLRRWLRDNLPSYHDVVGVSSLMSSNWTGAYALVRLIKEVSPKTTIVMGGPHATAFPDHVFKYSLTDYVCLGEGEEAFLSLLQGDNHEAIISRRGGGFNSVQRTSFIKDLDTIPFPRRTMLLDDRETKETYVTFSRACPHKCSFCGSHIIQGRVWRNKSVDVVLDEIAWYYSEWGVRHFVIEDDNPCPKGVGMKHFKEILREIVQMRKDGFRMSFNVSHGIPVYATADPEMCELLWDAGFKLMSFPVESTNRHVLKDMNKTTVLDHWERAIENWSEYARGPHPVQIILGYPFVQTIKTMLQTMLDIHSKGCLVWASHFRLNKGTELYERCLKKRYIDETYDPINTQAFFLETERFKKKDLQELMQISRGLNFATEQGFNILEENISCKSFHSFNPAPPMDGVVAEGGFAFKRNQNVAASIMLVRTENFPGGRPFVRFGKDNKTLIYGGIKFSRVYNELYAILTGRESIIKKYLRRRK